MCKNYYLYPKKYMMKKLRHSPGQVAQLVGTTSHTPKGCRLDSLSGHIPRSWVRSPVGMHMGGNRSIFLLSYQCFFLSLSLSLSLSPSPHFFCLKSINISLGENFFSFFLDETEAQRLSHMSKVTQLARSRAKSEPRHFCSRVHSFNYYSEPTA